MKHLFVPYWLALLLKEKGFDETCLGVYVQKIGSGSIEPLSDYEWGQIRENVFSGYGNSIGEAPLYQQVVDWFWDNHEIDITCGPTAEHMWWPMCTQFMEDEGDIRTDIWPKEPIYYPSRYEALTETIKHAITLLP